MAKFMFNLQFFTTPVMIGLAVMGIAVGGGWVWTGVGLMILAIVLDRATRNMHTTGAKYDDEGVLLGIPWLLNNMMYSMFAVFVIMQLFLAYRVMTYVDGSTGGTLLLLGFLPMSTSTTASTSAWVTM